MNERTSTFPATLIILLGGALLGAVAAALTTPKTGKEVRDRLRITASRIRERFAPGQAEEPVEMTFI